MKLKATQSIVTTAGATALLLGLGLFTSCEKKVEVEKTVGLDFSAPIHYLSHNVEAAYPTSQAIPKPGAITRVDGGAVSIQSHPDSPAAQLRVIRLPKDVQNSEKAAEILAESGAVQDCDVLLSFRPMWSKFNGYCNIQLGISHTALATIETPGGKKFVKTVESPLSYSSRLDYDHHYAALDYMHILRPNLTGAQKKNVKAWALQTLNSDHSRISFFTDYGTPYKNRKDLPSSATGNLPVDLAKTVLYPDGNMKVSLYCSELVWALLALRDINPSDMRKQFPSGSGDDVTSWLTGKVNPLFDPLPGASDSPLVTPGLMQGPDVQMRGVYKDDDAARRKYLLDEVLLTKSTNPAETEGHLSPGHAMAANMFRIAKLPAVRSYYSGGEPASAIPNLNNGIYANYSPTAFFLLGNLPESTRKFAYVGTVSFNPPPAAAPATSEPTTETENSE